MAIPRSERPIERAFGRNFGRLLALPRTSLPNDAQPPLGRRGDSAAKAPTRNAPCLPPARVCVGLGWWARLESNQRPRDYESPRRAPGKARNGPRRAGRRGTLGVTLPSATGR